MPEEITAEDLLTDAEVLDFIAEGYHMIEPDLPPGLNEAICEDASALEGDVGNEILLRIPRLTEIYSHPAVVGALTSILGADYAMDPHRHLHTNGPGSRSQTWHQDGTNVRHHQVWCVLGMYFPHDVTAELGPTIIMPGTHLRNAPTDQLASYANLRGQVPLTVKAGSVAITHYDLWHAATRNKSDRPRYMLKFLFNRVSEPTAPSWNSDPETIDETMRQGIGKMVGTCGYSSDYYKEWELRTEMWDWMRGQPAPVPPGAFRQMLG